jgi:hypothetical protein
MKIAFTICSNNYLAQASVLMESFKKYNSGFHTAIVLVDEINDTVNYAEIKSDEITLISELDSYCLIQLYYKYNIIELSTAIKPFVFKYYIEKYADVSLMYYFDPDLKFFSDIDSINEQLLNTSIVLTPHITSPILPDGLQPQEPLFLNYGIYNLGFLGLNPCHADAKRLLEWWGDRTFNFGYDDIKNGLFVDQLWMNFAPIFFSDVLVSLDKGLNMGPWNLHERRIQKEDGNEVLLHNGERLKFYHFSSYNYNNPEALSKYYSRYDFSNVGLLEKLYRDYQKDLLRHHVEQYSKINYVYGKRNIIEPEITLSFGQRVRNRIERALVRRSQ